MGCTEWLEMNQKNKPQSNALATGILTLLITGSYLAATLFDSGLSHQEWTFGRSQPVITFTLLVFHVTAVAGSIAAYLLLERYTKKQINYVLVACVTVGCIVGVAVPSNLIAVAFGRGLMGFAHGLAYPVVLVHGGEILVKELRGVIMASVNFCIVSGVMLGSVINSVTEEGIPPYRLMGILGLFYMLLSVFLNYYLCYESPVFLVERKLDGQAIQSMIKLRNESNETWQIRNELTEIKTMLSEDELTSRSILQDGNLRPLVLIGLGKLAAVLSFNYAVNSIKYIVIDEALSQDHDTFSLATTVLMTIRLLGGMVGMFIVDLLGRRALAAVSSLSTGVLLVAIGITYLATDSLSSEVAMVVLFACEVGSSLGLTFVPDVLCSEAFNTRKKVLSIVVVQLLENVLQVIIFAITFEWNFAVQDRYGGTLLVAGVPLVAIAYVLYQKLPETSKMSIRQARIEFYKRDGIVFGGSKNSVEVLYD